MTQSKTQQQIKLDERNQWDTNVIILHSFTHLGEEKADPETVL